MSIINNEYHVKLIVKVKYIIIKMYVNYVLNIGRKKFDVVISYVRKPPLVFYHSY